MTTAAKKGKSSGAGKKSSPASAARVERKRKGKAVRGAGSVPKEGKGERGGKGGGLH
jgi:hypothetical protein